MKAYFFENCLNYKYIVFISKEWCTVLCEQSNRQFLCKSCDLEDKEYGAVAVADLQAEQVYVWKTSKGKSYEVKLLRVYGKKKVA